MSGMDTSFSQLLPEKKKTFQLATTANFSQKAVILAWPSHVQFYACSSSVSAWLAVYPMLTNYNTWFVLEKFTIHTPLFTGYIPCYMIYVKCFTPSEQR